MLSLSSYYSLGFILSILQLKHLQVLFYFPLLQERSEGSVMSGYVKRIYAGRTEDKFYRLVHNVLYAYGAHEVREL